MKYTPLPFIGQLAVLESENPKHAQEVLNYTVKQFFGSDAAQILANLLRVYEREAMEAIGHGFNVERNVGRLSLIRDIRDSYTEMLAASEESQAAMLEAEAEEEFATTPSDFLIPYPGSEAEAKEEQENEA